MSLRNTEKFSFLISNAQWVVHNLCNKYFDCEHDRQDMFQIIMEKAWKSYPGFRNQSTFSSWLYAIARNTCVDYFRRVKQKVFTLHNDNPLYEAIDYSQYIRNHRYQEQILALAIEKLRQDDKDIIYLYLDGNTHKQIASVLGITENAFRVRFSRAKERMKRHAYSIMRQPEHL